MAQVSIKRDDKADALVLRVCGPLTVDQASAWRRELRRAWQGSVPRLVFDLSGVTYLDTAGVALLLTAARCLPSNERTVALTGLNPQALRVLALLNLNEWLRWADCDDFSSSPARAFPSAVALA